MEDLIKALQIFLKYRNERFPTICVHDTLIVTDITLDEVSDEDEIKLDELGFNWNEEYDNWTSYRYGSA